MKKALVLCNERVMAIWIFARYKSHQSLVLVLWALSWHRFCVEDVGRGSKYMLGRHYPPTRKHPLSSPFGRGWGSSIAVILFYFLWWILAICEKCFERRIPQILFIFKSPKIATILPIVWKCT
jgi:hypothetical protein